MDDDKLRREAIKNWKRERAALERCHREEPPLDMVYHRKPASTGMKWAIIVALAVTITIPIIAYVQDRVISMSDATLEASGPSTCQIANDLRESRGLKRDAC